MKHSEETPKTRGREVKREEKSGSNFLRGFFCRRAGAWRSLIFSMWCAALGVVLTMPAAVFARPQQPDREVVDGRLEGYSKNVTLEGGSTALTWLLLIVLAAICLGVMFKNAKRTHLD